MGVALFDLYDDDDMKKLIAMDLSGRFPIASASENKYIFVVFAYDSDYIKFTPMISHTKEEMIQCFKLCYTKFKRLVLLHDSCSLTMRYQLN